MSDARSCFICQENSQRLKYFHVPRNSEKLKAWTAILNGLDIKTSSIVCQKHFLKEHIKQNFKLNCLRLSKEAIPFLYLPDSAEIWEEELEDEDVFDEGLAVVANKRERAIKKNMSTQTNLNGRKMCAYVTVSNNLSSYKVNCFCCDKSFSLSDWHTFVAHVQSKPRSKTKVDFETVTLSKQISGNYKLAAADDYTELQVAAKKRKISHSNQISEHDDFANEAVSNENATFCDINLKAEPECKDLSMEFNLATAQESLVFDIIDLLRSAPVLWFENTFQLGVYDKKLKDLSQEFFKKYNNQLLHTQLYKAIDEIRAWYQQHFKNQTADKLPYSQKEYYQRCDKFLADKSDGKTCQLCKLVFNDHLQYYQHMRTAHPIEIIDERAFSYLVENVDDYLTMRYASAGNAKNSLYCQLCRQGFKFIMHFFQHVKKHLHKRSFVCRLCGSAFIRRRALIIHLEKHAKNVVFKKTCKICKKSFNDLTSYKSHQKNCHRTFEGGTVEQIEKQIVGKTDETETDLVPVEAAGIIDELSDQDFSEVMPQIENEKQMEIENSDSNSSDEEIIAEPKSKNPEMKMLPFGTQSINQLNIQTSDPSLVLFIIDLMKSTPTLWFENLFRTVKYETTLQEVCERFSEVYPEFMTQIEFYDSIEVIRNWYQEVFMAKSFNELTYPQSEYYRICDEFLADTSNGKTCTTCERVFNDHLQYFGHKKLESKQQKDAKSVETTNSNNDEEEEASAVSILKQNVESYLNTRYAYNFKHSFDCQACPNKHTVRNRFIGHIKTHLQIREFVCDLCGSAFLKHVSLWVHRKRHLGTMKKQECKICDQIFNDVTQLKTHRLRYHLPVEGTIEEIEADIKRRKRRGCKKRDNTLGDTYPDACNICGRVLKNKYQIPRHKKLLHPKEWEAEVAAKKPKPLKKKPKPKTKQRRVLRFTNDAEFV